MGPRVAATRLSARQILRRRYTPPEAARSAQASQSAAEASDGMRQSPRGDRLIEPTLGPSGRQERLYWLAKKRRMNTASQRRTSSGAYGLVNEACEARWRTLSGPAP